MDNVKRNVFSFIHSSIFKHNTRGCERWRGKDADDDVYDAGDHDKVILMLSKKRKKREQKVWQFFLFLL